MSSNEFGEGDMRRHVGFIEHALHELREEHRHLAELALDPAAREQRAEDVEILLQTHFLAAAQIVVPVAEGHVQVVREAAPRRIELCRERAELDGEDRIVTIHDRRLQPFEQRRVALAEQTQRLLFPVTSG